jgi:CRP-like cAMP-binding protein
MAEGDHVHDLHVLLAGSVELLEPSHLAAAAATAASTATGSRDDLTRNDSATGLLSTQKAENQPTHAPVGAGVVSRFGLAARIAAALRRRLQRQRRAADPEADATAYTYLSRQDSGLSACSGRSGTADASVRGGMAALRCVLPASGGGASSTRRRQRLVLPGDAFGELAFFTNVPMQQAVRSLDECRVLVVSRAAWQRLATDYILAASKVLANLQVCLPGGGDGCTSLLTLCLRPQAVGHMFHVGC